MKNSKSKILITGGCGFIGTNFVRYIHRTRPDLQIINFDKLTYAGSRRNLIDLEGKDGYIFIQGDNTVTDDVSRALAGVDYVVNLAAETHVDRSITKPSDFIRTNVLGTFNLLEEARKVGVKKFIQVSTDEVYGSLGSTGYFTESSSLAPNSPYSASKAAGDMLARSYFHTYGFPVIISRCSNNYGPFQDREKLIPLMISNALVNKQLPVYGKGLNIRDWLYVEDHCRALELLLQKGKPGEVYNIGSNNEWRNIDIVKLLLERLEKPESLIEFVTDRLGHDWRYALDTHKIREQLGWKPLVSFEEGLNLTLDYYKQHNSLRI